jgi:hypothetical protein
MKAKADNRPVTGTGSPKMVPVTGAELAHAKKRVYVKVQPKDSISEVLSRVPDENINKIIKMAGYYFAVVRKYERESDGFTGEFRLVNVDTGVSAYRDKTQCGKDVIGFLRTAHKHFKGGGKRKPVTLAEFDSAIKREIMNSSLLVRISKEKPKKEQHDSTTGKETGI